MEVCAHIPHWNYYCMPFSRKKPAILNHLFIGCSTSVYHPLAMAILAKSGRSGYKLN
jgi:hypothetical protein